MQRSAPDLMDGEAQRGDSARVNICNSMFVSSTVRPGSMQALDAKCRQIVWPVRDRNDLKQLRDVMLERRASENTPELAVVRSEQRYTAGGPELQDTPVHDGLKGTNRTGAHADVLESTQVSGGIDSITIISKVRTLLAVNIGAT